MTRLLLATLVCMGAGQALALTQEEMRDLVKRVAEKDLENTRKQHEYTFTERREEKHYDSSGHVKSTEVKTFDVMWINGQQVRRLVAVGDKPVAEKDIKSPRANPGRDAKDGEQERQFMHEVADAYDFHFIGIEAIDNRETYVIDGTPRAGYVPRMREARILPKFRFRVWIDKQESQWRKAEIFGLDSVSIGWVLARLAKGSHTLIEQTRVNDEVWLPLRISARVDLRLALFKDYNVGLEMAFRDYKKFRVATKVVTGDVAVPQSPTPPKPR